MSSGPEAAVRGIVEDVVGKAKEIIGIVLNNEDLRKAGRAQQEKADAQRDVAKKEAEAAAARGAEKAAEAREKSVR
ncbi:CsbD family protein [Candidatus Mycobacterium wuenschmannii]|uniref:CsbD family protein n=1 Tax=Candidatus Mycobacterium wuenschmannii TaxID=3027808 RepID=A0ABY8VSE0_9MYCO|nr:CsbD family protein [Candidatus Mycobacterium wuenschmannii]WIM86550.1 CsbD family protein [Candidatus Mycobacterium wuenschmannii]